MKEKLRKNIRGYGKFLNWGVTKKWWFNRVNVITGMAMTGSKDRSLGKGPRRQQTIRLARWFQNCERTRTLEYKRSGENQVSWGARWTWREILSRTRHLRGNQLINDTGERSVLICTHLRMCDLRGQFDTQSLKIPRRTAIDVLRQKPCVRSVNEIDQPVQLFPGKSEWRNWGI